MLQRAPQTKTLNVLVATPVAATGQGGIDRVMGSLKSELERDPRGVAVTFAATRGAGHIARSPFVLSGFIARMIREKLAGRLDLVHLNLASHGSTYRKMAIAAVARSFSIPYVIHLHGGNFDEFWKPNGFLSHEIRRMFAGAARVLVLGQTWRDFVVLRAPEVADRVEIVPNATPHPARPSRGGGDVAHILFLGRIGARKGAPQLGEALRNMRDVPGWRATIAGDGEVEAARSTAVTHGISDRVDIPGWVDSEGVAELIDSADILVLPSFAENLPLSVIEGMAAGLAVVTTPVGAVPDIIVDGETGLLVQPGDIEGLTTALIRVVEDPALRVKLGANARRHHRERLDVAPYAEEMSRIWRSAVR